MAGRIVRLFVAVLAVAVIAPAASSAAPKKRRIKTTVQSQASDAKQVKESYVRLYAPLPAEDGARPPACDWIGYLRFRHAKGPTLAKKADAVFVTMPGIFAGA